jgi:hypothetical protein
MRKKSYDSIIVVYNICSSASSSRDGFDGDIVLEMKLN